MLKWQSQPLRLETSPVYELTNVIEKWNSCESGEYDKTARNDNVDHVNGGVGADSWCVSSVDDNVDHVWVGCVDGWGKTLVEDDDDSK